MDELVEQFLIESRELVAQASSDFSVLVADPANGAAIESMFRAIHTLKGSFAIFALTPAERVLHSAEEILERVRRKDEVLSSEIKSFLLACLDQTDRWIDDFERLGELGRNAVDTSNGLIARLKSTIQIVASDEETEANWIETLSHREHT